MIEKDIIDEIIFRTDNPRNRLMLELMARGGMRIGEVLNPCPIDCKGCRLYLSGTKSGKETEIVFIPQKKSDRLKEYIQYTGLKPQSRIFPISYAATYASCSGTPIEIISKVVLRHFKLSTTQRYLGKVSDTEAMRWIENLYG